MHGSRGLTARSLATATATALDPAAPYGVRFLSTLPDPVSVCLAQVTAKHPRSSMPQHNPSEATKEFTASAKTSL